MSRDDTTPGTAPSGTQSLETLAAWYLRPDVHVPGEAPLPSAQPVEALVGVLMASHCIPFARTLSGMTGWQTLSASSCMGSLHFLVRSPDGRMLDAGGWVTERDMARRYGVGHLVISEVPEDGRDIPNCLSSGCRNHAALGEGELYDPELARLVSAVRALPHPPFTDRDFRAIAGRPVPGVDIPFGQEVLHRPASPPGPVEMEKGIALRRSCGILPRPGITPLPPGRPQPRTGSSSSPRHP